MKAYRKDADLNLRMTKRERGDLNKAARVVTRQRKERIRAGTLARELINAGVERILGEIPPATTEEAEPVASAA